MTCHTDSNDEMFVLLEQRVREVPHIPVSILSNHTTHDYGDLVRLCDLWADSLQWRWTPRVTLELFDRTRVTSTVRTSGASIGALSKRQRKYTGRKNLARLSFATWARSNRKS